MEQFKQLPLKGDPGMDDMTLLLVLKRVCCKRRHFVEADFWNSPDILDCFDAEDQEYVTKMADKGNDGSAEAKVAKRSFQQELDKFSHKVAKAVRKMGRGTGAKRAKTQAAVARRPDPVPASTFTERRQLRISLRGSRWGSL